MILNHSSKAGSLESNDLLVLLTPLKAGNGIQIEINSIVKKQFGNRIMDITREVINSLDIKDIKVFIQDRGALDCTIKARLETAIMRGIGEVEK